MYEDRTSDEIERGFREKIKSLKIQISGFTYLIDYQSMVQLREDRPNRKRKIKRDTASIVGIKGVAGIYMGGSEMVSGHGVVDK